ncbi:MAG: NAD(+) diphosphatase [Desulfobacteraceae bacterium]|nr:NAD(+) diphosphatase [Desulfobacteraceae bacterium]
MDFIKSVTPPTTLPPTAYFFIFSNASILVRQISDTNPAIPCMDKAGVRSLGLKDPCFFGTYKDIPCYCGEIDGNRIPPNHDFISIRSLFTRLEDIFWQMAGYARQIHDWNTNFKFCGKCGTPTNKLKTEVTRVCPSCNLHHYPRISPAIITAIVKDNQILLARGVNFPNKRMFSVLAGFVEPGESLEECVQREVFEEVGIRVKNIIYFKSQSWPFPDSLMIGFTAEYDSGLISMDPAEILDAGWFDADHLPMTPGKQVLAGELIDWFVQNQKTDPC